VRLLRELSRHGGQLSAPALVRVTGLAKGSVSSGLATLEMTGLISVAGSGRAHLYCLRSDHPLRATLDALFLAEERRFDAIKEAILAVAHDRGPGLLAVWLDSSLARGEDGPDSDADMALVAKADACEKVAEAFRDRLLNPASVFGFTPSIVGLDPDDIDRLANERDPWWLAVKRDAKALAGPLPTDLLTQIRRKDREQSAAA
jgi:predicted nucleotidyltransferase